VVRPLDDQEAAANPVVRPPAEPARVIPPLDAQQAAAHPVVAPPPEPTALVPSPDAQPTAALTKLGEELLKQGDIATARVLLKRAAIAGDTQAALQLGRTYDQAFLAQWGVLGFAADAAQAREWYDRAIKLGSTEASRHLERLANVPK